MCEYGYSYWRCVECVNIHVNIHIHIGGAWSVYIYM